MVTSEARLKRWWTTPKIARPVAGAAIRPDGTGTDYVRIRQASHLRESTPAIVDWALCRSVGQRALEREKHHRACEAGKGASLPAECPCELTNVHMRFTTRRTQVVGQVGANSQAPHSEGILVEA